MILVLLVMLFCFNVVGVNVSISEIYKIWVIVFYGFRGFFIRKRGENFSVFLEFVGGFRRWCMGGFFYGVSWYFIIIIIVDSIYRDG